jgi:hypothetical protein
MSLLDVFNWVLDNLITVLTLIGLLTKVIYDYVDRKPKVVKDQDESDNTRSETIANLFQSIKDLTNRNIELENQRNLDVRKHDMEMQEKQRQIDALKNTIREIAAGKFKIHVEVTAGLEELHIDKAEIVRI